MRPIGIDLFAGVGGLSLGFEQAGFDVVAAVEIDPIHCAAHAFNFPQCAVIPKSIVDLTGEEIRERAKIGDRKIDVVFGGAPCQGFSLIGHRALDDPRNSLVKQFVRIVGELEPSCFVFENVKGLTVGRHRKFLDEVIEAFEDLGYKVRSPWRVLNAADYGVPQDRERVFLIGAKDGATAPTYPKPITAPAGTLKFDKVLCEGPCVREAIGDLPNADDFPELFETDEVKTSTLAIRSAYAREMRCLTNDCWHFGHPRIWNPTHLTASMRTDHSEISRRRFTETAPGTVEPISRFYKLDPLGISNTLRAGTDSARGAFTSPRPIHYEHNRCITVREMARLHGFPDWFRFHETKWHGARQIGNAVPPPLARAVAGSVIKALGRRPSQPEVALPLGDVSLLRIGMAEASARWQIDVPIGRRDRKSGARKRSQAETEAERLAAP
ncbi:MAG TPA: DNA cytosine methyltransferase [Stellaceae bacterium]|nr:DNA cytosine methyltransferase [Stellaceae bacterium]